MTEAERIAAKLAEDLGEPPPPAPMRELTEEDKAAVAAVAEDQSIGREAETSDTGKGISSTAQELRNMGAEEEAQQVENLS